MAAEAADILDALMGGEKEEGGFFENAGETQESAQDAWKNTRDSSEYFKNFGKDISVGDDGSMSVKDPNGKEINLSDIKTKLNNGDFLEAFKSLGLDEETLNSESYQNFFKESKARYEAQPGVTSSADVKSTEASGKKLSESLPSDVRSDPTSAEELEDRLSKVEGGDKTLDQLNDRLKKIEANSQEGLGTKVGRWVKYTIAAGAVVGAGVGLGYLVDAINKHKNKMNGCWMVNLKSGEKCKIPQLTCNKDCNTSDANTNPCGTCESQESCKNSWDAGTSVFNPCILGSKPKITCVNGKCTPSPSPTSKQCQNDAGCGDMPGKYHGDAKHPSEACDNCTACAVPCSGDASCSSQCNCSTFQCYPGFKLTCVDVDFWGAAEDFLGEPLQFGSSMLKKILMILLYIAIGIVVIFLLIKLTQFLIHKIKSRRTSSMRFRR